MKCACDYCYHKLIEENNNSYNGVDDAEVVICKICGYKSKELSIHIIRNHGISPTEYKNMFPGSITKSEKIAGKYRGENNPAYQHGGKLSPFSKKFIHYESEEQRKDIQNKAHEVAKKNPNHYTNQTKLQTYLDKGLTESEAKEALSERQATFTLAKCITRYGKDDGTKIWQRRQDNWQASLNLLPDEEKARINKLKLEGALKNGGSSGIEKELFSVLSENFDLKKQLKLKKNITSYYSYDMCLVDKIIEFNGDYWHANPRFYSSSDKIKLPGTTGIEAQHLWAKDLIKINAAITQNYDVLVIWEYDYKTHKKETIQKCISFLTQ